MSIAPEEIKAIRAALGITQPELAEKMGVSRDAVASWEIGRNAPGGPAEILLRRLERKLPISTR